MSETKWSKCGALAAAISLVITTGMRAADVPTQESPSDVQAELNTMKAKIAELEKKEDEGWISAQKSEQIREIVQEVMADAKTHTQYLDSSLEAGYDNGFFIRTADKNFSFKYNGFVQYRFTYGASSVPNSMQYGKSVPAHGDINGFDFRYARQTFSGNVFSPNLTYLFTGDFASDGSNVNNFQLVDGYFAYHFTDAVNVRAGAFLVPFTRTLYIASGLQFIDFDPVVLPFNPDRAMGASIFGDIIKDKLQWEINVNDGAKTNHSGRAADVSATGQLDNRLGFASREVYYGGSAKPADFLDESDLRKDNTTFAWMVGAGVNYDSQNDTSSSFPAKQSTVNVPGVGNVGGTPGYINSYPLNGDIYRATIDGSFKYRGFAFTGAGLFQQINERPGVGITMPAAGSTTIALPAGYVNTNSFSQYGYYGQAGYMLTSKIEGVARIGELRTERSSNAMQEYAVGLNYYVFGKNFKIQSDFTYIPTAAAYSNSTIGSVVNTEDLIFRTQVQLKW